MQVLCIPTAFERVDAEGDGMVDVLDNFFEPDSVAVIGASGTPSKPGNDVIRNILANEFPGKLYLVNPKSDEIMGMPVHASIQALPRGIDLAIIILPARLNPQAIRECAERGIRAIVLAAGGFSEVGGDGAELEEDLRRTIAETGVRVIGPNTSGHTSTPHRFTSSFFPLGKIPRGNISYIAQTGNFATHTMRYIATGEHFGVARVIGLGNKVDIEESEILDYLSGDPETEAIFIYLESIENPVRFFEVARGVTRKKPVFLLKGGTTPEGAAAAVAHTAAMATEDRLVDGFLRQAGIIRLTKYSQLFQAAKAVSHMSLPRGRRVSFLAPSGAMLVVLSDFCLSLGLQVPQFSEPTRQFLQDISPPIVRMRNPVDIWFAAGNHGVDYAYGEGMRVILEDPNIDAVVPILLLTDDTGVPPLDFIVELAEQFPEKPIYVTFSGERKHMDAAKAFLEPKGIPTFHTIEEPFEVLSLLARSQEVLAGNR